MSDNEFNITVLNYVINTAREEIESSPDKLNAILNAIKDLNSLKNDEDVKKKISKANGKEILNRINNEIKYFKTKALENMKRKQQKTQKKNKKKKVKAANKIQRQYKTYKIRDNYKRNKELQNMKNMEDESRMYNFNRAPPGYLLNDKYKYRYPDEEITLKPPDEEITLKPRLFPKKKRTKKSFFATSKMFQPPHPSELPKSFVGGSKKRSRSRRRRKRKTKRRRKRKRTRRRC